VTYSGLSERAALISGFRALADYLESNPDVPVSGYVTVYVFPPDNGCAGMRAEIDFIAALLGVTAGESANGHHYAAVRSFGPVEYRAVAICKHHHHDARKG
jgi:hypothetical protein